MSIFKQNIWIFAVTLATMTVIIPAQAQSTVEVKDGELILANQKTQIIFDAGNLSLKSWHDNSADTNVFIGNEKSLFSISLGSAPYVFWKTIHQTIVTAPDFAGYTHHPITRDGGAGIALVYSGAPVADSGKNLDVTVEVWLPDDSSLAQWQIKIVNDSNWPLAEIHFPCFSGIGFDNSANNPAAEYVAVPLYSGVKVADPRHKLVTGQMMSNYPGSGLAMQLLSYCNDLGNTFYFAAHDSENYTKSFVCEPTGNNSVLIGNIHYADQAAAPGAWALPYPIVAGPLQGDWYECAKSYRQWTLGYERWKPLAQRNDIMPEFRDLALWWSGHPHNPRLATGNRGLGERIVKLKKYLEEIPFAYHWYIWYDSNRHDFEYPDMFLRPGADLKEGIANIQKHQIPAMLYTNILLFETFLPEWKNAEAFASRNLLGELNKDLGAGMWKADDPRFFTGMCFGTEYWVNKVVSLYQFQHNELATNFFYMDQLCNYPALCYAPNHNHSMPGGNYIAEGEREIARRIRNLGAPGTIAITGEGVTECYIDVVDGLLNAHADTDPTTIPFFQTVYSDRTTEIGVFISESEAANPDVVAAKMAFNLIRGRQMGWVNEDQFDAFAPANHDTLEIIKHYARVRMAVPELLFYGEMLRSPRVNGTSEVTLPWYTWIRGRTEDMSLPNVQSAVYRAPNGEIGIILANSTGKDVTVEVVSDPQDWDLKANEPVTFREFRNLQWGAPRTALLEAEIPVTVPSRDAVVIKISPN